MHKYFLYQCFPIILWSFRYFGDLSGNSSLSCTYKGTAEPPVQISYDFT